MKKYTILALVLVLCAVLFAGCRSRNTVNTPNRPETGATTTPTGVTTMPTTHPTTEATRETTMPTTEHTPEGTHSEPMDGIGGMEGTDGTEGTGDMEGRMRRAIPGTK